MNPWTLLCNMLTDVLRSCFNGPLLLVPPDPSTKSTIDPLSPSPCPVDPPDRVQFSTFFESSLFEDFILNFEIFDKRIVASLSRTRKPL